MTPPSRCMEAGCGAEDAELSCALGCVLGSVLWRGILGDHLCAVLLPAQHLLHGPACFSPSCPTPQPSCTLPCVCLSDMTEAQSF